MQTICSESLGVDVQTGNNLFEVKGFSNSGSILSDFKWYFLLFRSIGGSIETTLDSNCNLEEMDSKSSLLIKEKETQIVSLDKRKGKTNRLSRCKKRQRKYHPLMKEKAKQIVYLDKRKGKANRLSWLKENAKQIVSLDKKKRQSKSSLLIERKCKANRISR